MASLRIPLRYRPALKMLANLREPAFLELRDRIAESRLSLNFDERFAASVSGMSAEDAELIIGALVGLQISRGREHKSAEELSRDVSSYFNSKRDGEDALAESEQSLLSRRLADLLSIGVLEVSAKAAALHTSHQHVFTSARIYTDIRAVFRDDVADGPAASVITHMLSVHLLKLGERTEFFVALDQEDLKQLEGEVSRAIAKEHALQAVLEGTKLTPVRSESE